MGALRNSAVNVNLLTRSHPMIHALLLLLVPFLGGIWIVRRLTARTHQRTHARQWDRFEDTEPGFVHRLELRQKPKKPDPTPQSPETLQPNVHWLSMRSKQRSPRAHPKRAKQSVPPKSSPPTKPRGNSGNKA